MRRLLLFALLGPTIGYVAFVVGEIAVNGVGMTSGMHFGLPVGFLFGLLPALCVGGIDWFLADKLASKPRLIVAIVTGYFAAAEMLMLSSGDWNWSFGLIGAIAAAICSWMSDEKRWTG